MTDGRELEKHVQQVFSFLLNLKDEGVVVGRDVQVIDKFGLSHQVDVFYQFERAGVTHKVAIECKDHGRPIENGEVAKFYGKMCNAGALSLVIVSRLGYQRLAIEYAEKHDILLLTVNDLPRMNELLAKRLRSVALPDASAIGEPFWTIMEIRGDQETGSFFAHPHPTTGKENVLLFYSRAHAEAAFAEAGLSRARWGVRGMPRYVLRSFLIQLELFELRGAAAAILFKPPGAEPDAPFITLPAERAALIAEYYGDEIPSIKKGSSPPSNFPS